MPIYEYECRKCGKRFEKLIRNFAADVPKNCPACHAPKPVKAFSSFSVAMASAPSHEPSAACASCPSGSCPYSGGAGE